MRSQTPPAHPRQRASAAPDPFFATTLARGLDVLAAFRPGDGGVANSELAARTGLTRPTVSRLTNTLLRLGYLRRSEAGKYVLSTRVLRVAYPVLAHLRIRQLARPLMREFAEQARGTVSIGTIDGTDLVYIETARMSDATDFVPDIGVTLPLVQAAMGRALLAMLPQAERQALLGRIRRETPDFWKKYGRSAERAIQDCGEKGFCFSLGDFRPEIHAVAAPLLVLPEGEVLAINCGVPVYRLRPGQLEEEIGPRLAALAASIRGLAQPSAREAA
jgi:DNA-binding IclR family transcriptional regulator